MRRSDDTGGFFFSLITGPIVPQCPIAYVVWVGEKKRISDVRIRKSFIQREKKIDAVCAGRKGSRTRKPIGEKRAGVRRKKKEKGK